MIQIASVLCPVDFSETSRRAFDYAAATAHWYGARLTVVYVHVNRPSVDLPPFVLDEGERTRLLDELRRFTAGAQEGLTLDLRVDEAPYVDAEIVRQAAHADLLVLGTHGRTGFERLVLGSVTEKAMRRASCPTLVVPPAADGQAAAGPAGFKRVLCAIDFSETSLLALEYAFSLAQEADARLTLLHTVEIPAAPVAGDPGVDAALAQLRTSAVASARERLAAMVPADAHSYCDPEPVVVEGRAHHEVLRRAVESQADLIVMGVRGRGAVDLLVFGSTTNHVVRSAPCPVLVVRGR